MTSEQDKGESLAALERVRRAEEEARRIIQEAKEKQVPRIVQDAFDEAHKIKQEVLIRIKAEAEERKKAVILQAREEARKIKEEAEKEASEIDRRAQETFRQAVKTAARRVQEFLKKGKT